MRNFLFKEIEKIMGKNKKLFFLTGDTGFNLVEGIFKKYPSRAINVGVAEQNLVGIASGLSNMGYIPIVYAITNFIVHRSYEQTRNDLCLHNKKSILIGTSTGYDNSTLGPTHHIIDDIGALKIFPNIKIYSPSTRLSTINSFKTALNDDCPSFIRITKNDFYFDKENQKINKQIIRTKSKKILITHGRMLKSCYEACIKNGYNLFVFNLVSPLYPKELKKILNQYKDIIVVEDNFKSGLYNSICEIANELSFKYKIKSLHPSFEYVKKSGSQDYFDKKYKLSLKSIKNFVIKK